MAEILPMTCVRCGKPVEWVVIIEAGLKLRKQLQHRHGVYGFDRAGNYHAAELGACAY